MCVCVWNTIIVRQLINDCAIHFKALKINFGAVSNVHLLAFSWATGQSNIAPLRPRPIKTYNLDCFQLKEVARQRKKVTNTFPIYLHVHRFLLASRNIVQVRTCVNTTHGFLRTHQPNICRHAQQNNKSTTSNVLVSEWVTWFTARNIEQSSVSAGMHSNSGGHLARQQSWNKDDILWMKPSEVVNSTWVSNVIHFYSDNVSLQNHSQKCQNIIKKKLHTAQISYTE